MIRKELIETIASMKSLNGGKVHAIRYQADYRLSEALKADIINITSLRFFVEETLLKIPRSGEKHPAPEFGCSSFLCEDRDQPGVFYMGRNFDDPANQTIVILHTKPWDGYASIGISDASWIGLQNEDLDEQNEKTPLVAALPYLVLDGVNEKGVAISLLKLDDDPTYQATGKYRIMPDIAIRLVLDRAENVREAVELIASHDMQCPSVKGDYHFMITDASGESVVVEHCHNELFVKEAKEVTNFYLCSDLAGLGHGQKRYERMVKTLCEKEYRLSREEARGLLDRVNQRAFAKSKSRTHWSVLYDLAVCDGSVVFENGYKVESIQSLFEEEK